MWETLLAGGGLALVGSLLTQILTNRAQAGRDERERLASLDRQYEAHADTSFAAAQQASIERRLDAGERIYSSLLKFHTNLPAVIGYIDILVESEYGTVRDNPHSDALFGGLNEEDLFEYATEYGLDQLGVTSLYVDGDVYALYTSYTAMMMRIWILLIWSQTKDIKHIYWHKDNGVKQFLDNILTSDAKRQEFDSLPLGKLNYIYRLVEWEIRDKLRQTVTGHRDGSESRKRTYADAPQPYRTQEEVRMESLA